MAILHTQPAPTEPEKAKRPPNRSSEELAMRALIVPKLRAEYPGARIVHELPIRYSTNRIDLAAITPDAIISVEIKSSRDVIDRLEAQLRAFEPISVRTIVALAPKWNEQLPPLVTEKANCTTYACQYTEAQEVVRRVGYGIEIWTVDAESGTIKETWGGYSQNRQPWLAKMLHMLHVAELRDIADRHRISVSKRPTHDQLHASCCELMTGREVITAVCAALRARPAFAKESDPPISNEGNNDGRQNSNRLDRRNMESDRRLFD